MGAEERKIEQWLDAALKQYGAAEAAPDLEERVLARLRTEPPPAPLFRRWWVPAAIAMAAVLAVLWLGERAPRRSSERASVAGKATASNPANKPVARSSPVPLTAKPAKLAGVHRHHKKRATTLVSTHRLPKLRQFPSAQGASEQDQLLLAYLRQTPQEELAAVIAQQKNMGALIIKRLEIPPLEPDEQNSESHERSH